MEGDGVPSFIRVVDRWMITGTEDPMPLRVVQTTLVVMMRSGSFRGSSILTVIPTTPSGVQMPAISSPILFEGDDDRGAAIVHPIGFPVQESGAYWFDVAIDGNVLTRTAIRVVYLRAPTPPAQA